MEYSNCILKGLTESTAEEISQWEYEKPYDVYNFKGHPNGYLMDKKTWGKEQFILVHDEEVIGHVACQFDRKNLWVGWALKPTLCGKQEGYKYISKYVQEIRKINCYSGDIYLRVAASNKRAIKAYQKAGFVYKETIQDGVAYSNIIEDFWVMTIR